MSIALACGQPPSPPAPKGRESHSWQPFRFFLGCRGSAVVCPRIFKFLE